VNQLNHSLAEIREGAVVSLHLILMKWEVLQAVAETPGNMFARQHPHPTVF
jgi:hypothetical protein